MDERRNDGWMDARGFELSKEMCRQVMPCPPGLVYEEKMSSCVWASDATTLCEDVKLETLDDGFSCPRNEVAGPLGRILPHPTYPHPEDCAKFYICRNGMVPQKGQCDSGTVYNEESFRCTEPELVQGWYVSHFTYTLDLHLTYTFCDSTFMHSLYFC